MDTILEKSTKLFEDIKQSGEEAAVKLTKQVDKDIMQSPILLMKYRVRCYKDYLMYLKSVLTNKSDSTVIYFAKSLQALKQSYSRKYVELKKTVTTNEEIDVATLFEKHLNATEYNKYVWFANTNALFPHVLNSLNDYTRCKDMLDEIINIIDKMSVIKLDICIKNVLKHLETKPISTYKYKVKTIDEILVKLVHKFQINQYKEGLLSVHNKDTFIHTTDAFKKALTDTIEYMSIDEKVPYNKDDTVKRTYNELKYKVAEFQTIAIDNTNFHEVFCFGKYNISHILNYVYIYALHTRANTTKNNVKLVKSPLDNEFCSLFKLHSVWVLYFIESLWESDHPFPIDKRRLIIEIGEESRKNISTSAKSAFDSIRFDEEDEEEEDESKNFHLIERFKNTFVSDHDHADAMMSWLCTIEANMTLLRVKFVKICTPNKSKIYTSVDVTNALINKFIKMLTIGHNIAIVISSVSENFYIDIFNNMITNETQGTIETVMNLVDNNSTFKSMATAFSQK